MKITLIEPIKQDGVEITQLEMKKPNFGTLIEMQKRIKDGEGWREPSEVEQGLAAICVLCGLTPREAKELSVEDATELMARLGDFLTSSATPPLNT